MALEAADMNDNTILEQTKQESDGKGNVRFKINLPDGHPIVSEWISPDNRKKALFAWIEVVKNQAASRSAQREEEIKAQIRRQRDEAQRDRIELPPGIVRQTEYEPPAQGASQEIARNEVRRETQAVRGVGGGSEGPLQYVLARAEQARKEMLMWERIASELTAAHMV